MLFKHSTCQTKQIYGLAYSQGQSIGDPILSLELEKNTFLRATNLSPANKCFFSELQVSGFHFNQMLSMKKNNRETNRMGWAGKCLKTYNPSVITLRLQGSTPMLVLLFNWKPCLQPKWFPTAFWTVQSLGAGESHMRVWLFRWEQQARNGDFLLSPINILIEQFSLKMFYS